MNTARLDISDPKLKEAVAAVRSDATADKYCIFGYEGKSKIVLKETGSGSMADMVDSLNDGEISYVLLRGECLKTHPTLTQHPATRPPLLARRAAARLIAVEGGRDQESKAVKFSYVVYVGPSVGGMARGRVSSHKMDLKVPCRPPLARSRRLAIPRRPHHTPCHHRSFPLPALHSFPPPRLF